MGRGARADQEPAAAEFFAGIGLVRRALENAGCNVVFANDISAIKRDMYARNFGAEHFLLKDVRAVKGDDVPQVDLATASFPCTDTSLAGSRAGLAGKHSSLLWEFIRILGEMGSRKPPVIMLENVAGFATSNGGKDLKATVEALELLGYSCAVHLVDAAHFIPQSRRRVFVIGSQSGRPPPFVGPKPQDKQALSDVVERLPPDDAIWWPAAKVKAFLQSMSPLQRQRMDSMRAAPTLGWVTAYRRTRNGKPTWEARSDDLSGCLRTTRGGSSKQALVEAGKGSLRVRWMTAREYARLMGVPDYDFGDATESQARFAMGDAVCVPVIEWLAKHYLIPLALDNRGEASETAVRGELVEAAT